MKDPYTQAIATLKETLEIVTRLTWLADDADDGDIRLTTRSQLIQDARLVKHMAEYVLLLHSKHQQTAEMVDACRDIATAAWRPQ